MQWHADRLDVDGFFHCITLGGLVLQHPFAANRTARDTHTRLADRILPSPPSNSLARRPAQMQLRVAAQFLQPQPALQ